MKKVLLIILITLTVLVGMIASSCSDKSDTSTQDERKPSETTVVIETTSEGGTVEKDAEENIITKDDTGKVISVVDKDGNTVSVTEYLTTHSWIEEDYSTDSISSNGDSIDKSSGSKSSDNGSGKSDNKSSDKSSQKKESAENKEEDEVPVIIATLPDDEDLENAPDL